MKGYIITGMLGLCLVLGLFGQFGSSWLTETDDVTDGVELVTKTGLREAQSEMTCDKDNQLSCDFWKAAARAMENNSDSIEYDEGVATLDMGEYHDECVKAMENAGLTSDEDCDEMGEVVSAGTWGGITLWMGSLSCIACLLMIYLPKFGVDLDVLPDNVAEVMTWATGILTGLAVLLWYVMLPDGGDASAGLSFWLTIIGGVVGLGAGATNTFMVTDEL